MGDIALLQSKYPLDLSIMRLVRDWADNRSKDPNTKVAAAVYDPHTGGVFLGYNGFLPGAPDDPAIWNHRPKRPDGSPDTRDLSGKYAHVIHAERNAIRKAVFSLGENITRCHIYITNFPCFECVRDWICLFGIKVVAYADQYPYDPVAHSFGVAQGVEFNLIPLEGAR